MCDDLSCVSLRVGNAGVLLEVLLRDSIEGKTGNGAFKKRRGHAPGTAGAAPTAEVVAIDPDQMFVHTICLCARVGIRARTIGLDIKPISPTDYNVMSHGIRERPSAEGASTHS